MADLKILACSDLHNSPSAADMIARLADSGDFDALVIAGDFTTEGPVSFIRDFIRRISIRVFAVPGNCDPLETVEALEDADASVHNTQVEFEGLKFFGFGGAVPGAGMPFEVEEDIIERSLRSVAAHEGVMVTHMPALGMNDLTRSGKHAGSEGILRVVNEFAPVLHVSGHIHESPGRIISAKTTFVNPGPSRKGNYASITIGEVVEAELLHQNG
jgi:Icc-related predicted phosphoesterase